MASESLESLSQKARQAIESRDWETARQVYQEALALKPGAADIHYGLATVCFQLRDLATASRHFKEVTRLDPLRAGAFINLGAVLNLLDQLDDAVTALRRGIQLDSQRAEGYYNLGLVYRRKGQLDLAVQAYREAVRVNPRMADAHLNLGNLYIQKEQWRPALLHYKEALKVRPNWDKAREGLEHVEAVLEEQQLDAAESATVAPGVEPTAPSRRSAASVDPNLMVDPAVHGHWLTTLHAGSIESDDCGRHLEKVLEGEVEPAIKELSSCLLYPDSPRSELEECVEKFEAALRSLRNAQENLLTSIERLRTLGDRLAESAAPTGR
jgi:tetratricopeptide (TPR) repeat protein